MCHSVGKLLMLYDCVVGRKPADKRRQCASFSVLSRSLPSETASLGVSNVCAQECVGGSVCVFVIYVCVRPICPLLCAVTIMVGKGETRWWKWEGLGFRGFTGVQLQRTACIPSVDRVAEEFPYRQRLGRLAGTVRVPVVV